MKRIGRSRCNKKLPCVDLSMSLSIPLANDLELEYGIAQRKIDISDKATSRVTLNIRRWT